MALVNHGLLLFFNHPFRPVRLFLEQFYRDRFAKIHTLTPPEGSASNQDDNVTYFYHGSYNFGGAFSYLLNRPELFRGMDWITVLHDDVILNPAFPGMIEPVLAAGAETLSPATEPDLQSPDWPWYSRMISRAFFPRHPIMGDGNEGALREMKQLYTQSSGARGESTAMKLSSRNVFNLAFNGALARWMLLRNKSLTADFEVPLTQANSDFFMIRQDLFPAFCHASGVLTRCGLFAEVAIPSAIRWLARRPEEFQPGQLDWSRRTAAENDRHFQIGSLDDIPPYFRNHAEQVAIHPIKVSKLLPK